LALPQQQQQQRQTSSSSSSPPSSPRGLPRTASVQERIEELREDMGEFKKAERRYRKSGHSTLEHEAMRQYDQAANELDDLLHPVTYRRGHLKTPWLSMLCLPCLLCLECFCFVSTGAVGEYSKKQKQNAAREEQLAAVRRELTSSYVTKKGRSPRGVGDGEF
jgi:hypothetical protein